MSYQRERGCKGRATPTYGANGANDRDTRVGIRRVGYIGGEGNAEGVGSVRTTFPELTSCRRGHAQASNKTIPGRCQVEGKLLLPIGMGI